MKNVQLFLVFLVVVSMSSCQIVGDIFKTGVGVGVFIVVAVIALIIFIAAKLSGGNK